jgi:hypothetical protein
VPGESAKKTGSQHSDPREVVMTDRVSCVVRSIVSEADDTNADVGPFQERNNHPGALRHSRSNALETYPRNLSMLEEEVNGSSITYTKGSLWVRRMPSCRGITPRPSNAVHLQDVGGQQASRSRGRLRTSCQV